MTKVATSRARVINVHFYPHAERTERLLSLKIKKLYLPSLFIPPANFVCGGYIFFTSVCASVSPCARP